jgi:hypothetical protein
MFRLVCILAFLLLSRAAATCFGQNVSGYDTIANPYLLLLREPAVLDDLELSLEQRRQLRQLNDEIDGPMLALRNQPKAKAKDKWSELFQRTQKAAGEILSADQRQRLDQIMLRVRGVKLVLTPKVAGRLKLSDEQKSKIQQAVDAAAKELADLRQQFQNAGDQRPRIEQQAQAVREREQTQVWAQLTEEQKPALSALIGRRFDTDLLGRVSFKAPDFARSDGWINSKPLRLANLRGKVVVLHFWAFG